MTSSKMLSWNSLTDAVETHETSSHYSR